MTGIPLPFVTLSVGFLSDDFWAPVLDSSVELKVGLVSQRTLVLVVGTLCSGSTVGSGEASLHKSRPDSKTRASPRLASNPEQCSCSSTSIFSSRNSSISSNVGWNDPKSCSSVSTLDQAKKSNCSSFTGLEDSYRLESQKNVDPVGTLLAAPKEAWDSR